MIFTCPLCGSSLANSGEEWLRLESACYYRCTQCDLVFLNPRQRPDTEGERSRYLEHNNSPDDPRYLAYLRGFAEEALLPYMGPPARVLDFGSGPQPVYADVLRGMGYSVDIFDPLFAPGKAWQEKKYDAVTAVEVAEHLFEPLSEFRRLQRVLVPGGYLVLRTLLHYCDRERFRGWWYRQDPTHVSFYSPLSFQVLAELLEMDLVEISAGRSVVLRRPGV